MSIQTLQCRCTFYFHSIEYLNAVCNFINRVKFIQNVQRFCVQTLSVCSIAKNKTKMSYTEKFINVLSRSYNKNIERKAIHTYVCISKCRGFISIQISYWYSIEFITDRISWRFCLILSHAILIVAINLQIRTKMKRNSVRLSS